ncbi:cysteine desulfurase family protein [Flavobacterium okayamense]|uniref:cysteine desulfurase n=1 Tax=Flavobacterium okayamense TaxID=2830782 RepID=A0ABM7S5W5_9FLAO|nr:cysteine desulfurase family protein [Flavobacterium okayamense]BCY28867.1 cysteine desulfurase [Flavobacterium okayamense]
MQKIYLDNAATTPLREEVIVEMTNVMRDFYGNPSSTHSFGRSAKTLLEQSRKSIAKLLNAQASEIIFTGSATEGTNLILHSAVKDLGIKRIITSKIEHHATLHTVEHLKKDFGIEIAYVPVLKEGNLDIEKLSILLQEKIPTLVSLIHVNNESGEILDIERVGYLCKENNALFHCDTVQSIGKTEFDLATLPVDFIVASAHKFHGPKGVGFAYIRKNNVIQPMIFGGEQEKGLRAGTEGVHQIVGMTKALELAYQDLDADRKHIIALKEYCVSKLKEIFPDVKIIGATTFYNLINVVLPLDEQKASMLLFMVDMKGIAVSRGSACQSGSVKPSHVLAAFLPLEDQQKPNLRISFSHYNTKEEIDCLVETLKGV